MDIDFVEGGSAEHVAAIRRHDLDVAFLAGTDGWSGCDMMLLWTEQVFVALSDKHRLARRSELGWHHLAGECLAANQASAEQHCHSPPDNRFVGVELCSALGLSGLHRGALLPLVAFGRVLTLTSETMATIDFPGVTHRPIGGETLRFGAVWLPGNDNPALRRLLAMARRQSDRSRC